MARGERLSGIGDQACLWDRDVYFRISNLIGRVQVYPNPITSTESAVAFARDLVARIEKA